MPWGTPGQNLHDFSKNTNRTRLFCLFVCCFVCLLSTTTSYLISAHLPRLTRHSSQQPNLLCEHLSFAEVHYIVKSIHSPIQIIEIRSSNHFHGHRFIKAYYKHLWKNGSLSGAQWIPVWYCDRMPPVQQVQSWNFLAPKYSTVNCQWYYNKVEAIGNNSNSASLKW